MSLQVRPQQNLCDLPTFEKAQAWSLEPERRTASLWTNVGALNKSLALHASISSSGKKIGFYLLGRLGKAQG